MYQRVGTRFGAFNIHHLLGAGGMAAVYYALYAESRQPVALKILSPQLAEVQQFRQRFELEAQITTRLEHPNIVPVIDYGSVDSTLFIAMRYLNGGSLHDHFVLQGSVSLRDTARYLRQLTAALDYAHGQGVIHRDLKLANVLLDDEQNVLLTDFGIARLVESSLHLTDSGSVLGSPHYMSPEQSEGKPLDFAFGYLFAGRDGLFDDQRAFSVSRGYARRYRVTTCQQSAAATVESQSGTADGCGRGAA